MHSALFQRHARTALALALSCALLACGSEPKTRVRTEAPKVAAPTPIEVSSNAEAPSGIVSFVLPETLEQGEVFAADLLPSSMLSGIAFEVSPQVTLDGHLASFKVKSDYGRLDAQSVEIVQQRIQEIAALAELEKLSEGKVFAKAAGTSLKNTGKAVVNVFRDPKGTARAIPDAVKTKVANTWASIKLRSKELSDDARGKIRGDGAPPEFNAFLPDPPVTPEKTWEDRAQSQGKKFGLSYIGYNSARRTLTKELNIDPYTSNPEIEDRLDAFAWSYLAGSAGTGAVMGAVTGGLSTVVGKTRTINRLVYDLPPEDIKKRNAAELKKVGVDGEVARNFLKNSTFTPTMQTQITDSIAVHWEIDGWKDWLSYLRYVDSEIEARFTVQAMNMLNAQDASNGVRAVKMVGVNPVFVLKDGRYLVPAPVDYVYYNAKLKAFLGEPQLRGQTVSMWVAGKVSQPAQDAIAGRGFELQSLVAYPGAPNYAVDDLVE
jgi:hypothetical protein